ALLRDRLGGVEDTLLHIGVVAIGAFADEQIDIVQERGHFRHRPRIRDESKRDTSALWTEKVGAVQGFAIPLDGFAFLQSRPKTLRDPGGERAIHFEAT